MSGVGGVCAATPRPPWSCAAGAERSKSDVQGRGRGPEPLRCQAETAGPTRSRNGGRPRVLALAGCRALGHRSREACGLMAGRWWGPSGVGGEADGRVSVAPQPRRRQGGLGGVPLLPAPEDTALPHPPVGQCRPGHPLSPSAAGGATFPVDPPPLCSTVTPQATPSSWLQQSLSAQSSPHPGPHPEPSPVSSAPLDTPVPQNKSSSLGLTRPCPHGGCWRPSSERPSALSRGNPSTSPPASPPTPPPGPVAGRRGATATCTSVPPHLPDLPSAPCQAPRWWSTPQPRGGQRSRPHAPPPLWSSLLPGTPL